MLGQVPNDAQHQLDAKELGDWYARVGTYIQAMHNRRVVMRQHPVAIRKGIPVDAWPDNVTHGISFEDTLDEYAAVICYNSTAGLEAIRRGVPVVCSENCLYESMGSVTLTSEPFEARRDLLHRVAYAQWNNSELRSGEAQDYWERMADQWLDGGIHAPPMWTTLLEKWASKCVRL
jgi:hypothetical protein